MSDKSEDAPAPPPPPKEKPDKDAEPAISPIKYIRESYDPEREKRKPKVD